MPAVLDSRCFAANLGYLECKTSVLGSVRTQTPFPSPHDEFLAGNTLVSSRIYKSFGVFPTHPLGRWALASLMIEKTRVQ